MPQQPHILCVCLSNQNPALMEHPLSLELEVTSPPRSTIKTSGASVAINCNVKVLVLPPGKPAVQLSSMTMVRTTLYTIYTTNSFRMKGCYKCTKFHLVPKVNKIIIIYLVFRKANSTQKYQSRASAWPSI